MLLIITAYLSKKTAEETINHFQREVLCFMFHVVGLRFMLLILFHVVFCFACCWFVLNVVGLCCMLSIRIACCCFMMHVVGSWGMLLDHVAGCLFLFYGVGLSGILLVLVLFCSSCMSYMFYHGCSIMMIT